jgi:thioesterase domain-containing protein
VRLNDVIQMQLFLEMWQTWCARFNQELSLHTPVILFRSEDPGPPDHGWAVSCPRLNIVPIRGGHLTIFELEHLEELAAQFTAAVLQSIQSSKNLKIV